ncbi:MAG TPA: response regulator [Holophagaceae bacterium]|nr:response regulator [Holophagaceae bacterium]
MRILVADDDQLMRTFVSAILAGRGHEVTLAVDGPSALARFESEPFPVVVFDWYMPGLEGPDLLKAIRIGGARPFAILLSGHSDPGDVARAQLAGFRQVLPKPLDPSALEEAIARAEALLA